MKIKSTIILGALLAGTFLAGPVSAQSLRDALAAAYNSNPTLLAQRAALRATDEQIARANSGFLPTIQGTINLEQQDRTNTSGATSQDSNPFNETYTIQLTQPLFRGFQTLTGRRQAKAAIAAGRGQLLQAEQQTLLDAVTVYMDVVRDMAVLELRQNNVQVLERQLQASRDRFRVGEITRTDVAQSEARLAGAVSAQIQAEADLEASRARYAEVIGQAPASLEDAPMMPPLPVTLDEAFAVGREENPAIITAEYNEESARHAVANAKGSLLPRVDGYLRYNRFEGESSLGPNLIIDVIADVQSVGVQLTWQLYQGGAEYSDIRRAKQTQSQRRLEVLAAERQVSTALRNAWEQYRAAQASIESNRSQVNANEIALDGVRQEATVGSRTTLDVLDAEQELLDSQVNLVRAERDQYVAGFGLLAAMGRLNAMSLDLDVELYDPEENYRDVRFQFIGWGTNDE